MPVLRVGAEQDAVDIFYNIFSTDARRHRQSNGNAGVPNNHWVLETEGRVFDTAAQQHSSQCIVMIMGFAAGQNAWTPQLHGLLHPSMSTEGSNVRVLVMDNRGSGRSSAPRDRKSYSTASMAQDIIALMEHVQWDTAHIVGHSMGGMIAMKLAALAPERVRSLTVISATGGGWQSLPFSWRATKYMWKMYRAGNDGKLRAKYDLKFHFMQDTLRKYVLGRRRKEMLLEEYTGIPHAGEDVPSQPQHAMRGQLSAIWRHNISSQEFHQLKATTFNKQVIHGRYDILAAPKHSESLARKMHCRCTLLEGAHFVTRECGTEINGLLRAIVFPAQALDPDHYMTCNAESDVVSSLRSPSVDLKSVAARELAAAGGLAARAFGIENGDKQQSGTVEGSGSNDTTAAQQQLSEKPSGDSPTSSVNSSHPMLGRPGSSQQLLNDEAPAAVGSSGSGSGKKVRLRLRDGSWRA